VTELSVAPRSVAAIRSAMASLDPSIARSAAHEALDAPTADRVREIAARELATRPAVATG
jgi:phosphoenolpyruvate-protein kinase (PTS system EI component)